MPAQGPSVMYHAGMSLWASTKKGLFGLVRPIPRIPKSFLKTAVGFFLSLGFFSIILSIFVFNVDFFADEGLIIASVKSLFILDEKESILLDPKKANSA